MKRLFRLLALGRMVERALLNDDDEFMLSRESLVWYLHVDGRWPLSPAQHKAVDDLLTQSWGSDV